MTDRLVQAFIIGGVAIGGLYLVARGADGWEDWVVFGVILLTSYGFAIAVSPRIYARRKRTISREGGPPPPGS